MTRDRSTATRLRLDASSARVRLAAIAPVARRLAIVVLVVLAVDGLVQAWSLSGFDPMRFNGDGWNYLAAGERLNAGHPLYALGPGDRQVLIVPPYWTVPLLAPPPIAVLFRPIALIGPPAVVAWAVVNLVATLAAGAYLAFAGGLVGLAVVSLLAAPLGLLALSGNVNGLVLAALVLAWRFRGRPAVVGPLVAFVVAMKLTPVLLLIWLATAGRRRAVAAAIVAGLVIAGISILGAGVTAHLDWLRSVPTSQPSPLSIATLTGAPSSIVVVVGVGIVLAVAVRRNEAWAYVAAVVASALVTPAFYFQAMGLLAAAAAPWTHRAGWPAAHRSEVVGPIDADRPDADADRDQHQPAEADRPAAAAP